MAKESAVMDAPAVLLPERVTQDRLTTYENEKAARREQQRRSLGLMTDCLDPDIAARYEKRKPSHTYKVSCQIRERKEVSPGRAQFERRKVEDEVEAQSPDDAWAVFCDRMRIRPNPNGCDRKIVKLDKSDAA